LIQRSSARHFPIIAPLPLRVSHTTPYSLEPPVYAPLCGRYATLLADLDTLIAGLLKYLSRASSKDLMRNPVGVPRISPPPPSTLPSRSGITPTLGKWVSGSRPPCPLLKRSDSKAAYLPSLGHFRTGGLAATVCAHLPKLMPPSVCECLFVSEL